MNEDDSKYNFALIWAISVLDVLSEKYTKQMSDGLEDKIDQFKNILDKEQKDLKR